jgi:hypothetical protein
MRPCAPGPEGAESTDGYGQRGRERCADRPEERLLTVLLGARLLTWHFRLPARLVDYVFFRVAGGCVAARKAV